MARPRFYKISGKLLKAEDHRYTGDTIYTIYGKIMRSVSGDDAVEALDGDTSGLSLYTRSSKKVKHFRNYALSYRRKKKKRKKSNISWFPKKKKK